ncbi:MAG: vWA domain-containing protein [Rhodanobacter sp.]
MSKEISNPLQALVKRAAQTLPAKTGKTALQQVRIDRRAGAAVILADVSGSMESDAADGRRKIDMLREAVNGARGAARLVAFSRHAREVEYIPDPESNTDLAAALEHVHAMDPGTTLLISDGEPDNEAAAIAAARKFRGAIDVLYIGPEGNVRAIDFMRRLAAAAAGSVTINDITTTAGARLLQQRIAGLLPGPRA